MAVTKSGTGTWDLGREDSGGGGDVGLVDVGTWGRWTRGSREVRRGDAETQELGDVGTQGRDKQTTPEFCAEFAIYNFRWSRQRYDGEFVSS